MNEIELTQELVNINSENPPGNEKQIAKFIYDYLDSLKIPAELMKIEKNRFNVVGALGKGNGLMLNGHLDTVPVGDLKKWRYDPFSGKVVDGKLYGMGASDMKGGVAAMLAAVKTLAREEYKRKLLLTFVADEEANSKGSTYLIKKRGSLLKDVKYGVIGEPREMDIGIANKGIAEFKVKFFGKSAHGSKPELGDNAILKASKFVQKINKLSKNLKIKDSLLGKGTINVGTIRGGVKVNVVPDFCEVELDRRIVPGETPQIALSQIRNLLKEFGEKAEIEIINGRLPLKISKKSLIVKLLKEMTKGKLVISTGYNESELYYRNCGIECISCGPGTPETSHTANEFIKIKYLKKGTIIYENLIRKWCL
jgi:succinyl-diaminopimelate desuccinylase